MPRDNRDRILREHLIELLDGGGAHLNFEAAIAGLPPDRLGETPEGMPYSPWRLVEHIRICQWDILEFCRRDHESPPWPEGYWPEGDAPPDDRAWNQSIDSFRRDAKAMRDLVADPRTDLLTPLPWGSGQTIAREAMLLADHNAYHLGQLVAVRRALGAWTDEGPKSIVEPPDEPKPGSPP